MKLYLSYQSLPELASYAPDEKRVVWMNFILWSTNDQFSKRYETMLECSAIGGSLLGGILGAILADGRIYGVFLGVALCTFVPMQTCRILWIQTIRKPLKEYIESPDFSLKPINQRAKMLLYPFTWHKR